MTMILRPVCARDQREYKVEKQGVALVEYVDRGGTLKPYTIYYADLWVCPRCGHQIIGGYGEPAAQEHEKEEMQKILDTHAALGTLYVVK